ncbi:MAG: hypothetical protein OEV44_02885 [Spirochaetota bacterium]|nr:hypothetical protein [Spirochaetota bacterium]
MPSAKSLENLKKRTPFSSTYQPEKNGRKPSKLKEYAKENNIGASEVANVIKNLIAENSIEELEEIAQDKTRPYLITALITAFLKDVERGTVYNLNSMLDRAIGSAKQVIEHSGEISVSQLTPEERRARIDELEKKRKDAAN